MLLCNTGEITNGQASTSSYYYSYYYQIHGQGSASSQNT